MVNKASDSDLKNAFSEHLEETKEHKNRLDAIAGELNMDLDGQTSKGMKGLINQAKSFISQAEPFVSEDSPSDVMDAGMIADGQRVEHYEISGYGTAIQYAKALNYSDVATTLQQTQDEEANADQLLNDLAVGNINRQAKASNV
jgi:ferritin-like metal-binding protein YciE